MASDTRTGSQQPLLVSVIVLVYNAETYLGTTLDSVLGQSHCNLEVIVVDDGSRDGTRALVEARAAQDFAATPDHANEPGGRGGA